MHMSAVRPGLLPTLKSVPVNGQWVDLDCSATSKSLGQCKGIDTSGATPSVRARAFAGTDVTQVKPFAQAYGANAPLSPSDPAASVSTWLFFVPDAANPQNSKFVVVVANDRPAECAFSCTTCLDSKHCPE